MPLPETVDPEDILIVAVKTDPDLSVSNGVSREQIIAARNVALQETVARVTAAVAAQGLADEFEVRDTLNALCMFYCRATPAARTVLEADPGVKSVAENREVCLVHPVETD